MKTVGRFLLSAIILFAIGGIFFMVPEQEAPTQENPFITLQHIMKLAEASIVESEIHYWASLGPSPENLSLGDLESRANEYLGRIVNQDQNSVCAAPQSFSSESASIKSAGSRDGSGGSSVSTVLKSDVFSEPEDQKGFAHVVNHSGYSAIKDGKDPSPEYMVVEREQELPSGGRARLLLQHMDQDGQKIMHLQLTIGRDTASEQPGCSCFRSVKPKLFPDRSVRRELALRIIQSLWRVNEGAGQIPASRGNNSVRLYPV